MKPKAGSGTGSGDGKEGKRGSTGKPLDYQELTGEERKRADAFLAGRAAQLKDMMSSGMGGVGMGSSGTLVANELLLLLPSSFVAEYERLFWQAFRDPFKAKVASGDGSEGKVVQRYERVPILASRNGDGVKRGDVIGYRNGKKLKMNKEDRDSMREGEIVALGKAKGQTSMVLGSQNRLGGGTKGKKFKEHGLVLGDERAYDRKRWVDQKLMGLARDIQESENGAKKLEQGRCKGGGCGRIMDYKWTYCPSCGFDSRKGTK